MNLTLARPVLSVSFVLMSLIGVGFLLNYWAAHDVSIGLARSALFVSVMGGVHWLGYCVYQHQHWQNGPSKNQPVKNEVWSMPRFDCSIVRPNLVQVALTQLPCLLVAAMLLDGGRGFRICVAAVVAHWLAIGLICLRGNDGLTALDRWVIPWGFFGCLAVAIMIGHWLW